MTLPGWSSEVQGRLGQQFLEAEGVLPHEQIVEEDVSRCLHIALFHHSLEILIGVQIPVPRDPMEAEIAQPLTLWELLQRIYHVDETQFRAEPPDEIRRPVATGFPRRREARTINCGEEFP